MPPKDPKLRKKFYENKVFTCYFVFFGIYLTELCHQWIDPISQCFFPSNSHQFILDSDETIKLQHFASLSICTCFVQLVGAPNLGLGDTRSNPVEA